MAKQSPRILELAKRGAELRLQDLLQEAKLLVDLFPHLRDAFDRDELPASFIIRRDAQRTATKARARRGMSDSARRAVNLRMKRYAASRRKKR